MSPSVVQRFALLFRKKTKSDQGNVRNEANRIKRSSKRLSTLNKQPVLSPSPSPSLSLNHNHNSKNNNNNYYYDNNNLHDRQARRSILPEINLKETDKMTKVGKVAKADKVAKMDGKLDECMQVLLPHLIPTLSQNTRNRKV
ncbi:hypothetical protein BGZ82_008571 [Podila clonocystis]|nr:hypothetical protein BGZ82_008571 [Podila clonocystis]